MSWKIDALFIAKPLWSVANLLMVHFFAQQQVVNNTFQGSAFQNNAFQ